MRKPVVILLGCAWSVWEDADRALSIYPDAAIAALNDIGAYWPGHLDFWITRHPDILKPLQELRRLRELNMDYVLHEGFSNHPGGSVSEALGYLMGLFDLIVLAGVPLDDGPHFYSSPPWSCGKSLFDGFKCTVQAFSLRGRLVSMSGRTKYFLEEDNG